MVKIPESRTYKSLGEIADPAERLRVAGEAGRGLAIYGDLTCAHAHGRPGEPAARLPGHAPLLQPAPLGPRRLPDARGGRPASSPPIPRFATAPRSTSSCISTSPSTAGAWTTPSSVRGSTSCGPRRPSASRLLEGMESGRIRRLAIHGDTKLDNFLFSTRTGRVKALVDLDTIMPHTWLADWGDMVRSLVNVAGEKERDLSRVQRRHGRLPRGGARLPVDGAGGDARGGRSHGRRPADHRPRAGPQVPHGLPARRQLLQARARRSAGPQPGEGHGAALALPPAPRACGRSPAVHRRTCARSSPDHGPPGTQDRRLGRSRRRGRRAHAGADRELRLRLRDVVRRRPRRHRARHAPVEHRVSRRGRLRAPLDGLPGDRPRREPEPAGVLRHPRTRRVGGHRHHGQPQRRELERAQVLRTGRGPPQRGEERGAARHLPRRRLRARDVGSAEAGGHGPGRRGALPRVPRERPRRRPDPRRVASGSPSTSPTARAAPSPRDSSSRCAARCSR